MNLTTDGRNLVLSKKEEDCASDMLLERFLTWNVVGYNFHLSNDYSDYFEINFKVTSRLVMIDSTDSHNR